MFLPLYPPLQKLQLLSCGSSFRSLNMDLFPNLKTLSIGNNHYFEALSMSDGKSLEELTYLHIEHCGSFVSFPNGVLIAPKLIELSVDGAFSEDEGGLPVSLSRLRISYDVLLRMKWNWQTLSHLTILHILGEGFPTSLTSLEIDDCPLVKKKYDPEESGNEEYWANISHIPNVQFETSTADDRGDFTT
ncbi:hypothetical protein F8388_000547 [Cannabis sativa]|uniref:Uncharacterized protein n=1 Tax=Cannabis sativa TaxID=3483 RepID=A0A7J6EZN2_CANSA|nr:hypothetical protein F8388_000547 [Cannabis sativa]